VVRGRVCFEKIYPSPKQKTVFLMLQISIEKTREYKVISYSKNKSTG
jgi:hypothetical protein